jgi:tetratricopeptide (TPR) repeat protein
MGIAKGGVGRSIKDAELDARLLAYLSADGSGGYVIAPGAGRPAAPRVMAEALEPRDGWAAALLRLAIAPEPSYLVEVTWSLDSATGKEHNAVAHISRVPGDRVMASGSFRGTEEALVEIVGCFCITFLRSQPRILGHTPRWERWSQDINGYRAYRDGLKHQRRGMMIPSLKESKKEYRVALASFREAARFEPANLLVQLHRAALLELMGEYQEAADIYEKCRGLWPESIETGYRLGNARKNTPGRVTYDDHLQHLGSLKAQLSLRRLMIRWLHTLRPWRWNPGERHYWRSWLQLRLPGRVTKRATYLHAVAIGELITELARLKSIHDGCAWRHQMTSLMGQFATEILRRTWRKPVLARLLHPETPKPGTVQHDHVWHSGRVNGASPIPIYRGREHRGDIGWLASYNAACFFSLSIKLDHKQLPDTFTGTVEDWEEDCARAAIRELGVLVRNPRHGLEPDWLRTDPDLKPLRSSPTGQDWSSFVDL